MKEQQVFEFDWAIVIAKNVLCEPVCADEWEMTVKPKDGGDGFTRRVIDADYNETLYDVARRVYMDWMKDEL